MKQSQEYFFPQSPTSYKPNYWDAIVFFVIFALFALLASAASKMSVPYQIGSLLPITLDPGALPHYALRTVIRMFVALFFSLLFSLVLGTLAAKYRQAERVIIPAVDILQSVPILGFLSISIVGFIWLFPNSLMGPECAAIFAIFTSQAWNMVLSIYQSIKTVPHDVQEAGRLFQLSAWQRFWRIEMPFAVPSLLWNMMMSMSGGWFFLVAAEAISVANQEIMLPGIGSYIALAIETADMRAVGYAISTMLIVILLYDQLLFRPLLKWSDKFKVEDTASESSTSSWVLSILSRGNLSTKLGNALAVCGNAMINARWLLHKPRINVKVPREIRFKGHRLERIIGDILYFAVILSSVGFFMHYILAHISVAELMHVVLLGAITATRVIVLIIGASLIWVPIGVWVGMRPGAAQIVQPIAQFLAAFPANLFFPVVVMMIVKFKLNVEIWTTPLMILGTQWYILFNVIAGASNLPKDLYHAAANFGLKRWVWWKRLALPAIFPYYVTGALTAAGGSWNASIVAEVVNWGDIHLEATGLGAYIAQYTSLGDFPRIFLGIGMMCIFVYTFNRLLWQRLYHFAQTRYSVH